MTERAHIEVRIRIVLADDYALFRSVVGVLLADQPGVEVVGQCGEGDRVIAMVEKERPDVLLLDLEVRNVNGFQVLEHLALSNLRVRTLVLTACREPAKLSRALELGARGIISKRCATEQLLDAIQSVCAGLRWIDPTLPISTSRPVAADSRPREHSHGVRRERGAHNTWSCLTIREQEVAGLVARGARYKDVARELNISNHTVKNHLRNIFGKLDISSRVQLALLEAAERNAGAD